MLLLVPRQEMLSRYLARVEGGWGEGVSPSPFIKIYERGRGDPFTPASGPLLPRKDSCAGGSVSADAAVRRTLSVPDTQGRRADAVQTPVPHPPNKLRPS